MGRSKSPKLNKTISELLEYWPEYLKHKENVAINAKGMSKYTDSNGKTWEVTPVDFGNYVNWLVETKLDPKLGGSNG